MNSIGYVLRKRRVSIRVELNKMVPSLQNVMEESTELVTLHLLRIYTVPTPRPDWPIPSKLNFIRLHTHRDGGRRALAISRLSYDTCLLE